MTLKRAKFIREYDGATYTLTDQDIEWLARSLWGECGEVPTKKAAGAAAWTMFLRFFRWPGDRWSSFKALIRAFSQPVNPLWLDPYSTKCQKRPQDCTQKLLDRREKYQITAWENVPYSCKVMADAFATGNLLSPLSQDYVDFASKDKDKLYGVNVGGNYFLDIETLEKHYYSIDWLPGDVLVDRGAGPELPFETGWGAWEYALLAAWAGIATWVGWSWWKSRKRG